MVVELGGDEFLVGVEAGGEGVVEFVEGVAADFVEGEEEGEGVEAGAVFFAGEVGGGGGGDGFEGVAEGAVAVAVEFVAAAEVFDEEEGADAGDDGAEEDADGVLALEEEGVEELESVGEVALADGVAEVPEDAGAALGDEAADGGETGAAAVAEVDVDLFEFVFELAGVVAGHLYEELEGAGFEGDAHFAGAFVGLGDDGLLPSGFGGVGFVEDFDFGELGEFFPGGAAFVDAAGAEDELHVGAEAGFQDGEDVVEAFDAGVGAAGDGVAQEGGVFEPDDFAAAEEGEGLEGLVDVGADATGVVGVVGGAFDDVVGEVAGVRRGEFADEEEGGLFDAGFVGADEGEDVACRGGGGFFRRRHGGPRHRSVPGGQSGGGWGRLLELDADAFFGAAGEEVVVGEDGVGPDFAFEDVVALEFGVSFGVGFDDDDFAFVAEGDDFVASEDDLAGAEAFFFPHVFAGADVDAGEGAFAVFFEAEHAVEVAVFDDGGAPVVEAFVFAAPDGFGAEAAAGFGDFEGAGTDAVTGGAVDDVFKDDGAGGGGDFVGEGGAPEDGAFLGVDGDEAGLGEEDGLVDAVDVCEDGGGVGHLVVLTFPGDFAGFFVEGDEGLAFAAAGEEEEAAVDEGGGGVLPFDVHAGVFFEEVVLPDEVAGVGFEAVDAEVGVDAVGVAVVDDGGGAGAVAAFVAFVAGVAAAVVFGDDGEGFAPFFLASAGVEAEEGFAGVAVDFGGDDGVGVFSGDSEGAEAGGGFGFPEGFEAGAFPVADGGGGFDGAVAVGAAEGAPFEGGGGAGDEEAEGGGEVAGIHSGSIEVSGCDG